jgi:hypothetical protein
MASKKLLAAYGFFSFLLLAAGVLTIAFDAVWRGPNLMRNLIISTMDLNVGLVIGIMYIFTVAVSVGAIIQPTHVTRGLIILNWSLLVDAIVTVLAGTIIWFFTLRERNNFHTAFSHQSQANTQKIQDLLQCCGYFNNTDLTVSAGFCQSPAATVQPCVGPITNQADFTLNNIFSSIYGFMAIIISLFLASMCVIKVRMEEERFRKIDEKRGGRGFV